MLEEKHSSTSDRKHVLIDRALLKKAIAQLIDAAKFQLDRTGCGGHLLITANALIAAEQAAATGTAETETVVVA